MKSLAKNSRAFFDYDFKDNFEAGLVLTGAETKSVKGGNVSLTGSYVKVGPRGAQLVNCHIGPYKYAHSESYNPTRSRTLLLQKREIRSLIGTEKGLTIIPLEIFEGNKGLVKVKVGVGRARKKQDKREYIKKRDTAREIKKHLDR